MIRMLTARDRQVREFLQDEKARKAFHDAIDEERRPQPFVVGRPVRIKAGVHHGSYQFDGCEGVILRDSERPGEYHVRIDTGSYFGGVYRIAGHELEPR